MRLTSLLSFIHRLTVRLSDLAEVRIFAIPFELPVKPLWEIFSIHLPVPSCESVMLDSSSATCEEVIPVAIEDWSVALVTLNVFELEERLSDILAIVSGTPRIGAGVGVGLYSERTALGP
jgi:hypothetical protein